MTCADKNADELLRSAFEEVKKISNLQQLSAFLMNISFWLNLKYQDGKVFLDAFMEGLKNPRLVFSGLVKQLFAILADYPSYESMS
ncbi:hypothetical protein AGMMS50296_3390 [Alphaproteobacteria bacterium]|nr:hypothetical protein AGMMS50296_3390 [Alphaproteobacteria bacterium]